MNKTTLKILLIVFVTIGIVSRLSVLGWLFFIGFFTVFVFGIIHFIVHYKLIQNTNKLEKYDNLLILLSHILFLNLFFFQADGGDDKSVFVIENILGHLPFLDLTNTAWPILIVSLILYLTLTSFLVYRLSKIDNSVNKKKILLFVGFILLIIVIPITIIYSVSKTQEINKRNQKETEGKYNNIDRAIKNIENVKYLRLYRHPNSYNEIPQEVFKLKYLEELEMYSNAIKEIPKEIESLKNLEKIDLCYNQIEQIPAELFSLPKLKKLNLMDNDLKYVSHAICECKSLEEIYLSGHSLDSIPFCINELPNLKLLVIESDSINKLFNDLKHFKNLKELRVYSYGGVEFDKEKYKELKAELANTKLNW